MKQFFGFALALLLLPAAAIAQDKSAEVARAQFTTDVVDREPVDQLFNLGSDAAKVYFFTDLRNLGGQTVTHRWEYRGEVMAEVNFNVGADRWRVWSSKNLIPEWQGDWTVVVLDGQGTVVHEDTLIFGP